MPKDGTLYISDDAELRKLSIFNKLEKEYFKKPIQTGYVNGYNSFMNSTEWHKCPEINIPTRDIVLLLGRKEDLKDNKLDSSKLVPFLLKKGEAILVYDGTLHYTPCKYTKDGYKCLVVLEEGTNYPLDEPSNDPLLLMKNKWLICHKDSDEAKQGAFIGITGENIEIKF